MKKVYWSILAAVLFLAACCIAGSRLGSAAARKQETGPGAPVAARPEKGGPVTTVPSPRKKLTPEMITESLKAGFPCRIHPESDFSAGLGFSKSQLKKLDSLNRKYFALFEAEYKKELREYLDKLKDPALEKEYFILTGRSEEIGRNTTRPSGHSSPRIS